MASVEVDSADVIKLMIQFCKENQLNETLRVLQEESQVALNNVDSKEKLAQHVLQGKWDHVLEATASLRLPTAVLMELYEQVVLELTELQEADTARELLRKTPVMLAMRQEAPERYLRLERLLQKRAFDVAEAYPKGSSKDSRRKHIAAALQQHVVEVPPGRLLALIGQALKWQKHLGMLPKGAKYDLFRGQAASDSKAEEDQPISKPQKAIKFGSSSQPECCCFSPDGQWLVSGSSDGFVEVWDIETGKLSKELQYQTDDDIMTHDAPVLSMSFSLDSELLATGSSKGEVKVWRILTGSCLRKFPGAHSSGVTAIAFARNGSQCLTGSSDTLARIHGLKSGRSLKEFRGHSGPVNCAIYSSDDSRVLTGSSDGSIRVWDAKSTDCLKTFSPSTSSKAIVSVHKLLHLPRVKDRIVVCNRSPVVRLMTPDGQVVQQYSSTGKDFVSCALSPKGKYLYAVTEDHMVFCFETQSAKAHSVLKLHEKEIIDLAGHPHRNVLASASADGSMRLWT